jgi:acyl dehydratase
MDKKELYFEDLHVGQTSTSTETQLVDAAAIKAFARQFDPQPFHLDEEAGKETLFKGLVASGWHTAAMTMSLIVKTDSPLAGGSVGMGAEISWTKPVRPGDTLHVNSEIIDLKPSQSQPDRGIVTIRSKTINQNSEVVQILTSKLIVPKRSAVR